MDKPDPGSATYNLEHFDVSHLAERTPFQAPRSGRKPKDFSRDRAAHAARLQSELTSAVKVAQARMLAARDAQIAQGKDGVYLELQSSQQDPLPNISWPSSGLRLGAVRVEKDGSTKGALFVPVGGEMRLRDTIDSYAREHDSTGRPKEQARIAPLEVIRPGTIESLWTDQRPLPEDDNQRIWWECWCWRAEEGPCSTVARHLKLRLSERRLRFPESTVLPMYANRLELARLLANTNAIAELRLATDTPSFFTKADRDTQSPWVKELTSRIEPPPTGAPTVCLLDSGVNRGHPLLAPLLSPSDCFTVDPAWGTDDHVRHGHGTLMAGAAVFKDLTYPLADFSTVALAFRLESVKLMRPPAFTSSDPNNFGPLTQSAISLPEIHNPHRQRVFCLAITNDDVSGERPTSWSSSIDQACAGVMAGDEDSARGEAHRRLILVSAGNIPDSSDPDDISDPDEFPVEDPAQAWNAVTVGGFTDKVDIAPEEGLPGWSASRPWETEAHTAVFRPIGIILLRPSSRRSF